METRLGLIDGGRFSKSFGSYCVEKLRILILLAGFFWLLTGKSSDAVC
jgi:hypothetical protein